MRSPRSRAALLILILAFAAMALAACGGDDDEEASPPATDGTPSGTKDTPTPPPADGTAVDGGTAPPPPEPELDEVAEVLANGMFLPVVDTAIGIPWDLTAIPLENNAPPPPCEQFVVAFGWQVSTPYPPAGVDIAFELVREGGNVEIGRGVSGTAQTGCGTLNIINRGQGHAQVTIHYKVGQIP